MKAVWRESDVYLVSSCSMMMMMIVLKWVCECDDWCTVGETRLTVDGRDRDGLERLSKLSDGNWHRIDIFQHRKVAANSLVLH